MYPSQQLQPLDTLGQTSTKVCTKCLVEKSHWDFAWDRNRRKPKCRVCTSKYDAHKRKAVQRHYNAPLTDAYSLIEKNRPPVGTPCELCSKPMAHTPGPSCMTFDHDPQTADFRGWICSKCNVAIGTLGDNIAGLCNAILYLNKTPHDNTH